MKQTLRRGLILSFLLFILTFLGACSSTQTKPFVTEKKAKHSRLASIFGGKVKKDEPKAKVQAHKKAPRAVIVEERTVEVRHTAKAIKPINRYDYEPKEPKKVKPAKAVERPVRLTTSTPYSGDFAPGPEIKVFDQPQDEVTPPVKEPEVTKSIETLENTDKTEETTVSNTETPPPAIEPKEEAAPAPAAAPEPKDPLIWIGEAPKPNIESAIGISDSQKTLPARFIFKTNLIAEHFAPTQSDTYLGLLIIRLHEYPNESKIFVRVRNRNGGEGGFEEASAVDENIANGDQKGAYPEKDTLEFVFPVNAKIGSDNEKFDVDIATGTSLKSLTVHLVKPGEKNEDVLERIANGYSKAVIFDQAMIKQAVAMNSADQVIVRSLNTDPPKKPVAKPAVVFAPFKPEDPALMSTEDRILLILVLLTMLGLPYAGYLWFRQKKRPKGGPPTGPKGTPSVRRTTMFQRRRKNTVPPVDQSSSVRAANNTTTTGNNVPFDRKATQPLEAGKKRSEYPPQPIRSIPNPPLLQRRQSG